MREMHGTQEIGVFLRTKRTDAGLTQAELAEKLHVTRQAISKWEQGRSEPDVNTLRHLAETLGFTMDELLGTAKDGESAARPEPACESLPTPPPYGIPESGAPWYTALQPEKPPLPPVLSVRETSAGAGALLPLGAAALFCLCMALWAAVGGESVAVSGSVFGRTALLLILSTVSTLLLGGLFAWAAARLPRGFGFLLCALLTAGSVCALTQSLFPSFVFSSDAHGYLNSWLLQSARDPLHPFVPLDWFGNAPLLYEWAQSTAAGIGPVSLLLYIGWYRRQRGDTVFLPFLYGAAAVAPLGPLFACNVLLPLHDAFSGTLFGLMSRAMRSGQRPAWPINAGALAMTGLLIAAGLLIVRFGTPALSARISRRRERRPENQTLRPDRAVHWAVMLLGILTALAMLLPVFLTCALSLKPNKELFLFPPRLLAMNPSFTHYAAIFTNVFSLGWLTPAVLSAALTLLFVLPAGGGLGFTGFSGKPLFIGLLFLAGCLSPFALFAFPLLADPGTAAGAIGGFFLRPAAYASAFLTAACLRANARKPLLSAAVKSRGVWSGWTAALLLNAAGAAVSLSYTTSLYLAAFSLFSMGQYAAVQICLTAFTLLFALPSALLLLRSLCPPAERVSV